MPGRESVAPSSSQKAVKRLVLCAAAALAICTAVSAGVRSATPDAMQAKVCIVARPPDSLRSLAQCCARSLKSDPDCRSYSRSEGFIILKDHSPAKPDAYLIIPTARVSGIEDPRIFAPPVDDFWADGWRQAQIYVKRPAAETGLAINSVFGRTQNQLHIHISCLRPDVARILAENGPKIGTDPAAPLALRLPPYDNLYRVIKVRSLTARSPFLLVAAMPHAASDMAQESIAVAGSRTPGVYFVLDTRHHGASRGAAEELLDQSCRGLR